VRFFFGLKFATSLLASLAGGLFEDSPKSENYKHLKSRLVGVQFSNGTNHFNAKPIGVQVAFV
jgi:hypothetical protein